MAIEFDENGNVVTATKADMAEYVTEMANKAVEEATQELSNKIRGLDRSNTNLQQQLKDKVTSSQTVEERIAVLENERNEAVAKANRMDAYNNEGLDSDWQKALSIKDPLEQAKQIKFLREQETKETSKGTAKVFGRDPVNGEDANNKQTYTMRQVETMSEVEVNKLWAEGRIVADPK